MPASPKVSVVMSTYNDAERLPVSIDSVLNQDFEDFEFIIVNDGSPDPKTGEILAQYAARDSRVRVITKKNEGLTKALIDGCAAAKGEYIARIDVGDVMLPSRLRQQAEILDAHPDVSFVSCWTEFCGPEWEHLWINKGKTTPEAGMDVLPNTPGENLLAGPTHHGSTTFRRDLYEEAGGYRWRFYYGQDWDLWYRLAELGRFAVVPELLYRVRLFPGGISAVNHSWQMAIGRWSLAAFWRRRAGDSDEPALTRAAEIRPGTTGTAPSSSGSGAGDFFIGERLRRNRDPRCRFYLRRAWLSAPFTAKYLLRFAQSITTWWGRSVEIRGGEP